MKIILLLVSAVLVVPVGTATVDAQWIQQYSGVKAALTDVMKNN